MNFNSLAEKTILYISDGIEESDIGGLLELEYDEGVLMIESAKGRYVLNKNLQMHELWLSSPISGAYHFKYFTEDKMWLNKDKVNLLKLLKDELFIISNVKIIWR